LLLIEAAQEQVDLNVEGFVGVFLHLEACEALASIDGRFRHPFTSPEPHSVEGEKYSRTEWNTDLFLDAPLRFNAPIDARSIV